MSMKEMLHRWVSNGYRCSLKWQGVEANTPT